ncbi:thiamine phosphate synthase [Spirosoma endbachense]|uniref:Thiamine-phosphate synthase n=1 Tax=Spirosoma endbachense TaxID=2666025 RepID=A0A6P1VRD0_9BACT|nr:thiamine phosphate synthase [Spirosoma endbachense]QHV93916.1 thiamine phosphate synthase [Spirosoma endbachense]
MSSLKISSLQYITTRPEQAEIACSGGADWIQLRLKNQPYQAWKAVALETLAVCRQYNARLIINDNPELAGEIGADGVHLGADDMPVPEARALLGDAVIIGGTANTLETLLDLDQTGVDYVGLGPFRFTSTKEKLSPILGLAGYQKILSSLLQLGVFVPVVAIGGITIADVPTLVSTGLSGVAVSSAISQSTDPAAETRLFIETVANLTNRTIAITPGTGRR